MDKIIPVRVFISHDSRDKDSIARPLAGALLKRNNHVWYDEYSLSVGESLRESIEQGLRLCRFCVLILTPNFLNKGGWPKREYTAAFTKEIVEKRRALLPVWAGVTARDVYKYSPILADRVGISWERGLDEVAAVLVRAMNAEEGASSRRRKKKANSSRAKD